VKLSEGELTTLVEDTGIGISEIDLTKLFKFFSSLETSRDINREGMGLGLTISKMILRQLKGDISVKSELKKGSVFTFKIPIDSFENSSIGN